MRCCDFPVQCAHRFSWASGCVQIEHCQISLQYADAAKNDFYVVNQYTFVENGNNRRPDIILFINGMPLVLMELKSPSKDEVGAENAYNQIRVRSP